MSRPTAPESSAPTPVECCEFVIKQLHVAGFHAYADRVQDLITAHTLARTEIKGHMMVEEELRAELAAHKTVIGLLLESLPECPFMGDLPGHVDEMKARIAELSKLLRDVIDENPRYNATAELVVRIDAALKDRA